MRVHRHIVLPTVTAYMTKIATTAVDITLTCSDGIQLAGQVWKSTPTSPTLHNDNDVTLGTASPNIHHRILCLHGWMDNCRSFHYFAPNLIRHLQTHPQSATTTTEVVALDLPGHGWSSHKSVDSPPILLSEFIYYVAEAIEQLNWTTSTKPGPESLESNEKQSKQSSPTKFTLVGHSMGAAISCLYAAAFPEQIQNLVLLDGAGPLTRHANDFTKHLRQHVIKRLDSNTMTQIKQVKAPRIYPALTQAIHTRMETAKKFPGKQYISEVAATELVIRGTKRIIPTHNGVNGTNIEATTNTSNGITSPTIDGYQFRHDPRLQLPSIQYITHEQLESIYSNMQCDVVLLLLAKDGWPTITESSSFSTSSSTTSLENNDNGDSNLTQQQMRLKQLLDPTPIRIETLPGSHHFHADPDTAEAVVVEVAKLLMV